MSGPRRTLARVRLPLDTWERHVLAARLAGAVTVLDVGGVQGQLALFLPRARVVTVNVEPPADVLFDGEHVPAEDASFEAVMSLDVLEHVAPCHRMAHVAELARVARRHVVVSTPLGTPAHVAAERELADWYSWTTGERDRFLDEHLALGLLTETELRHLAAGVPGFDWRLLFHGDFRRIVETFRLGVRARTRRGAPDLARYARRRLLARSDLELIEQPRPESNRAFLVGTRSGHPTSFRS